MTTEMDKITKEEVEKLAKLARLGLDENEKLSLSKQMTEILNYVKKLDEVDTKSVQTTNQVTGLKNIYAEDIKRECDIPLDELIANAPQRENGFIKVKSVLGDEDYSL